MSRALAWLCGLGLLALTPPPPPAAAASQPREPRLRAQSAIVVDARTGDVLLARRADRRRAIASATKLMTALLALERAAPEQLFTAAPYVPLAVESKIDLRPGERMTVRDLLRGLLLESANDAAVTLAEGISSSRPAFVRAMNRRARALELDDSSYSNPVGLDDPANYSTAGDLASLARTLMRDPRFRRVVDLPRAELRSGARRRVVVNRNLLVRREPFVDGIKTGRTAQAGFVLVGSASGRGARVISVVLGEPTATARDADSLALLRFGIDSFRRVAAVRPGRPVASVPIAGADGQRVGLVAQRALGVTVRRGQSVRRRVNAPSEVRGPLAAGVRVGAVEVVHAGRVVAEAPLVTQRAVPAPPPFARGVAALGVPLVSVIVLVAGALVALRLRAIRLTRARTRR